MVTPLHQDSMLLAELRVLAEQGHHREVLSRLEQLAPETLERRTPFALLAAEAHGRLGTHAEAERWATLALAIARARGERHAELRACNYKGAIALERGDVDAAEQHFAAGLELARTLSDHAAEARCHNNLGIIANLRGDPQAALASYQLALAAYQQAGLVRGMAETHHNIGISRGDLGDYRGALQAADEAVRLAGQVNDDSLGALALFGRAALHLQQGDADLAAAELARAEDAYERLRQPVGLAEVWRLQAGVARMRDDLGAAVALLRKAADLASEQGSAHTLAEIERDLGAALDAGGDSTGGRAAWARAIALYERLGASHAAQRIRTLMGGRP